MRARITSEFHGYWLPPQLVTSSTAVVNTVTSTAPVTSTRAELERLGRCRNAATAMNATTPMGMLM